VHMVTPEAAAAPPVESEIVTRLGEVDVLAPLSDDERQRVAQASDIATYSRGETILHAGEEGDSMFVLHRGRVAVRISTGGSETEIAQLEEGSVFGEMALLTGESRSADVVALTDARIIEISRDSLQPILAANPDLADAISARVIERRSHLESSRSKAVAEDAKSLLTRIRSYFKL
jgi:potassium efflux system protein